MSGDGTTDAIPETVREEAALWFARLRGPDAAGWQAKFDAWRGSDPIHQFAYDRASAWFALGAGLKNNAAIADLRVGRPRKRSWILPPAAGLAIAASIAALFALTNHNPPASISPTQYADARPVIYAATSQQQRTIGIADGSTITLDAASSVTVDLQHDRRVLRLVLGRARFDVAHESRPFMVFAGPTVVTAHGTIFDVTYAPDHPAVVRLLRGAVDVDGSAPGIYRGHRRLAAGDEVTADSSTQITVPASFPTKDTQWLAGLVDYDHARLDAVLAQANRQSATQILLADPHSAGLMVSGSFRIDDSARLASELAALFSLEARRQAGGRIVMERR